MQIFLMLYFLEQVLENQSVLVAYLWKQILLVPK